MSEETKETGYCMWKLDIDDIRGVAKQRGLTLNEDDFDEIARLCKKAFAWAVDDVWEEIIENAIDDVNRQREFEESKKTVADIFKEIKEEEKEREEENECSGDDINN